MCSEKACCVGRQPGLHLPCFFWEWKTTGHEGKARLLTDLIWSLSKNSFASLTEWKTEGNIKGLFIMIKGFIRKHHRRCAWCCTCDWIWHQNTPAESARLLQLVRASLCLGPVPLNCGTEVRSEWQKIAMFSLSISLSIVKKNHVYQGFSSFIICHLSSWAIFQ